MSKSVLDSEVFIAAMAGLTHDVGKVGQRAFSGNEGLSGPTIQLETYICPFNRKAGYHTHRHVLYTSEFFDKWQPDIEKDELQKIGHAAMNHHKPDDVLSKIIQEADSLSSGMEREQMESEDEYQKGAFRKTRLRSLLSRVIIDESEIPNQTDEQWVHSMEVLKEGKSAIPVAKSDSNLTPRDGELLNAGYKKLWEGILKELRNINTESRWLYLAYVQSILEKHTWCVPSATNVLPDISLFDHLKTTAAIAATLTVKGNDEKAPFVLAAGDIGGIQQFIFDVQHGTGSAAKRLRARSAFVSFISMAIANHILRECGMPYSNLIQSAGGKFYLLLPNIENTEEVIKESRQKADDWLRKEYSAGLNLNLTFQSFGKDKLRDDFGGLLKEVNDALARQKQSPLKSVLINDSGWNEHEFVMPPIKTSDEELCAGCRKKGVSETTEVFEEEQYLCDKCLSDIEDGKKLPDARYLAFYSENGGLKGGRQLPFGAYTLSKDTPANSPYIVFDFGDEEVDSGERIPSVWQFRAGHVPRDINGDLLTFEEIAKKSRGKEALAVLKADVDNLGYIFARGLKSKDKPGATQSISRMSSLSRMLDIFFAGRFDELIRDNHPNVYVVYAGGDDLLCFGPWNEIFDLAGNLRDEFRKFTAHNPAWGMSAGISIFHWHTPVLDVVSWAEEALDKSKAYRRNNGREKDAVTAFDYTLTWPEYNQFIEEAKKLAQWMDDGIVNTSQVRRLLTYARMHKDFERSENTSYLKFAPLVAYDIKRNWEKEESKLSETEKEALKYAKNFESLEIPADRKCFACEYALCCARRGSSEDENNEIVKSPEIR